MSTAYTLKISDDEAKEMPMVDLAFNILKAANKPFYYRDLMFEIAKIKGISDDEVTEVIAHLYTEINIDGRFACVGTNLWGLKRWYPVEKAEDPIGNTERPRIINDDDDDDDPFELEEEDEFDMVDKDLDNNDFDDSDKDDDDDDDDEVDAVIEEDIVELDDDLVADDEEESVIDLDDPLIEEDDEDDIDN